MKNYKLICILITIISMGISLIIRTTVYADNSNVGFSVSPNYNDTQNKDSSFFDLLVKPNSQQSIGVTVTNSSQKESRYTVEVIQASTNKNGIIDYSDKDGKVANPPFKLAKQASYDKEFKLAAGESKHVPIQINIPNTPFKGEVLGGVNVTKEIAEDSKENKAQLVNKYSYVIGLRIREGEENPERQLSAGEAKPEVSFGKTGVTVPLKNEQANTMGHIQVDSVLQRDGKEIKKETYKDREIAPNATYPYSLSWDRKDYLPGKYELTIKVTDAQKHTWDFKKEFTLSAEEVKSVKNAAVHPKENSYMWFWIAGIIGLIIIIGLIWYVFKLRKLK